MSAEELLAAAQKAPPALMRAMAQAALREATESLAKQAEDMAGKIPSAVTGSDALRAFAAAIRENNRKHWGGAA